MDKLTEFKKEQALKEFDEKQEKLYKTGKAIVFIIATIEIVSAIFSIFINFNFLTLILRIALSIALFSGVVWVRYFFAASSALSAFLVFFALMSNAAESNIPINIIVYMVFFLIYAIISSILLFTSKSVSEFLYRQKNG